MPTDAVDHRASEPTVSFVVIGLDEAENLAASIASLSAQGFERDEIEILYVDSGSQDDSVEIARSSGADELISIPRPGASAARGRNAGLERARARLVHFVDGDTRLEPGWARLGLDALEGDAELAGVDGAIRELDPGANLYDAVCELDWPATPGPVDYVGGNALYRARALREAGGFDPELRVGEEPELGARLRKRGWRLRRLDSVMARHHLGIRSFREYLRRNYTSGIACALVARSTGGLRSGDWSGRLRRTLALAGIFTAPLLVALPLWPAAPRAAALLALSGLCAFAGLVTRKALQQRSAGSPPRLALAFGLHTYFSKLPVACGILAVIARQARTSDRSQPNEPGDGAGIA